MRKSLKKYENYILTLLVVAANAAILAVCFDFYYDLNDDTMMLDIMSGAYSGVPDGHNMQTLYPLGALIALCYRVCGTLPWYGLFLCLCQFGCFYLTGVRLCVLAEKCRRPGQNGDRLQETRHGRSRKGERSGMAGKLLALAVLSLFLWGICLAHLVNIQYTVTCAVLSATAIFLFLTTPDAEDTGRFILRNLPAMALVVLAYQLRSEMLLLTFPFICLAGLYRLTEEEKLWRTENLFRYGGVLGIMLAGMLLSRGVDYAAYGSAEWKDFLRFFETRTTVYDFYPELVTDDRYREALLELGVTDTQQTLLRNYDYGLDDAIDTRLLAAMAGYAADTLRAQKDWKAIAREQLYRYYHRTFRGGDAPYSTLLLWLYAAVLLAGACAWVGARSGPKGIPKEQHAVRAQRRTEHKGRKVYGFLWQLVLLWAVRSAVWMFILLRGRDPERITHSLYLVEFALLAAMLLRLVTAGMIPMPQGSHAGIYGSGYHGRCGQGITVEGSHASMHGSGSARKMGILSCCLAGILAAGFVLAAGNGMTGGIPALREEQARRAAVNRDWYAIDAYCKAHGENFYFEDVYSTVSFSRKIFDVTGHDYANYDILGGWMCNSPLYYDKIKRYGIESVQKALLEQDNIFLILSDREAAEQGFGWITDHYAAQGIMAAVEKTDTIGTEYAVYKIVRAESME